jgi:hypothetical protein
VLPPLPVPAPLPPALDPAFPPPEFPPWPEAPVGPTPALPEAFVPAAPALPEAPLRPPFDFDAVSPCESVPQPPRLTNAQFAAAKPATTSALTDRVEPSVIVVSPHASRGLVLDGSGRTLGLSALKVLSVKRPLMAW